MHRLFSILAHLVVPLAAFVTFMLQPVVGKLFLPIYGGSVSTWLTIAMFFQGALLAGYALAWRGQEKHRQLLPRVIIGLAIIAPLSLRLPTWVFSELPEWLGILAALIVSVLPTVLLTTASGLVIQSWLQERRGSVPFYLYAISNIGSAIALIAYPFLIETSIGLHAQVVVLKVLVWAVAAAMAVLSFLQIRFAPPTPATEAEPEELPQGASAAWFLLSFATCTLMLSAIPTLSAEYGSNPLTWLLPLGIYLLSFSLTFSGWWRPWMNYISMLILSIALLGYMQTKGIGPSLLSDWANLWLCLIVLAGCTGGQGYLYQLRPERRSMFYYIVIGAGGLAAGIFVSAVAPNVFDRNIEFTAAAAFILVFLTLQLLGKAEPLARYTLVLMIIAPAAWFGIQQFRGGQAGIILTKYLRNPYGTLVLRLRQTRLSLSNESTLHGEQFLEAQFRRTPTTYYSHGSAFGIVMRELQKQPASLRVGSVGLGAGTVAAYGRKGDHFVFWDINPLAIKIAQKNFSFIHDSPAKIDIRQMDGRLGIASAPEKFDVLLLDAFSGDSVPAHLLTHEAFAAYVAKLDRGILLVHISSRYMDLFPVVAGSARSVGWKCFFFNSSPQATAKITLFANSASYAVVVPPDREAEVQAWFQTKDNPDFEKTLETAANEHVINWTDDRSAIIDLLKWENLIRAH
ncbi:MAG: hypothetical protein QM790_20045 [Nibricoccus sp.]